MVDGVIVTIIKAFVLINVLMGFFAIMTWVERRLIGKFQVRYGPNRVGPAGLLQPIADLGKMLQKENMVPDGSRRKLYMAAPFIAMTCALVEPRHFRTAMLCIFCSTKTRVTLDTAMPPRMTMMSPTIER